MFQPQLQWFKSSYSGSPDNECVECASSATTLHVRDSKLPSSGQLRFGHTTWAAFTSALNEGTLVRY